MQTRGKAHPYFENTPQNLIDYNSLEKGIYRDAEGHEVILETLTSGEVEGEHCACDFCACRSGYGKLLVDKWTNNVRNPENSEPDTKACFVDFIWFMSFVCIIPFLSWLTGRQYFTIFFSDYGLMQGRRWNWVGRSIKSDSTFKSRGASMNGSNRMMSGPKTFFTVDVFVGISRNHQEINQEDGWAPSWLFQRCLFLLSEKVPPSPQRLAPLVSTIPVKVSRADEVLGWKHVELFHSMHGNLSGYLFTSCGLTSDVGPTLSLFNCLSFSGSSS